MQRRPRPWQDGAERPGDRGGRGQDGQARPRGARAHGRGVRGAVLQEGARLLPARPVGPRLGDTQGDRVSLLTIIVLVSQFLHQNNHLNTS